ncbi:hypothetical protein [Pleomorphomonas sp. PLEO]|uniref:hypothetical protein n=1 Tax=Pleomorphomonas sp. PLEO TaxID=3239306 RepID=UPI00351E04A8
MQDAAQEAAQQVAAPKGSGRNKCILTLFGLSLVITAVMAVATGQSIPDRPFGVSRFIGERVGFTVGLFLISLLFFAIVRRMRKASVPTAGLGTGVVVMLIWSYLVYVGATHP